MTNTVALLFTGVGAAVGSRPELAGQATRVRRLGTIAALGGGAGAALLLITPSQTFVRLAPVLIGAASLALLAPSRQDRAPPHDAGPGHDERRRGAGPGHDGRRGAGPGGDESRRSAGPDHDGRRRGAGPDRDERRPWLLAGVFGVAVYIG